jgi:23S rRNA pseudouridine1911/1915/1917 synthase
MAASHVCSGTSSVPLGAAWETRDPAAHGLTRSWAAQGYGVPMEHTVAESHIVPETAERRRLDQVAFEVFDAYPTRSSAKKGCKRGEVAVDGRVAEGSRFIHPGQQIERHHAPSADGGHYPCEIRVLHEDDDLAVVFKPPGLRVNGNQYRTLERALPHNLTPSPLADAITPRVCHRLDAKTSGLVATAKTRQALVGISQAFMNREVDKRYRAVVIGRLDGTGTETSEVDARSAHTTWSAIGHTRALRTDWVTKVDLVPHTGRKHQLRVHMAGLGHPILGDIPYGLEGKTLRGKGLFLCAVQLAFNHPLTGTRIDVITEEPAKFDAWSAREAQRWAKYHPSTP